MSSTQHFTRYKWIISKLTPRVLEEISETRMFSEEFTLNKSRVKFNLMFIPNYSDNEDSNKKHFCSLHLNAIDLGGRKSLKVSYKMWLVDYYGNVVVKKEETETTFDEDNTTAGYDKIITQGALCTTKRSSIPGQQIIACCEIKSDDLSNELKEIQTFDEFKQKIWQFYQTGMDDNCTIIVGTTTFKVSKSLLIAQSGFFEKIFMLENEPKDSYEIVDVRLEIVKALIRYVYLGVLDDFVEFIDELFVLAVNYKFYRLQDECIEIMSKNVNHLNAGHYISLAFLYGNSKLKDNALSFARREPQHRHIKQILKSVEWKKLVVDNEELSDRALDAMFDKSFIYFGEGSELESIIRFKWTINDFRANAPLNDERLVLLSESFSFSKSPIKFHLKFEPTSRASILSAKYSSIYICVDNLPYDEPLNVNYRIWMENSKGAKFGILKEKNALLTNLVTSIGHPKFVCQDQIYSKNEKFIREGVVHIFCEIIKLDSLTEPIPQLLDAEIRQKTWSVYEAGINDSCVLQVEERPFKLPKTFLIAHSNFFERHFSNYPNSNEIIVEGITQPAMEALVNYLYLQNDNDLKEYIDQIFSFAVKYEFHTLKSKCVQRMGATINSENATSRLILAFENKDAKLKKYALSFVTKRPSSKYLKPLLKSMEWKEFSIKNIELSNEILNEIYEDSD